MYEERRESREKEKQAGERTIGTERERERNGKVNIHSRTETVRSCEKEKVIRPERKEGERWKRWTKRVADREREGEP